MEYSCIHNHQSQFLEMFDSVESFSALENIVSDTFPGEWGNEPTSSNAIKVIRTTNFTNEGRLDLSEVVTREIDSKKVSRKKLKKGDTILERSGGTKDNPVGRVVFFDEDGDYLFNNFTQVLRPKENVNPVYLFYSLYNSYNLNKAAMRAMASQTTGIQNLSMSDYMAKQIKLPSKKLQDKFESIYHQSDKSKFDGFKSQFLEWFGGDKFVSTTLPEISENMDYKRVPITSGDRNVGQFPYYGASGIVDYIDNYIFDEPLLLVSEDGANLKDRVTPIAFIAEGKYWVNNHAHVLKFTNFANMTYICHFFNFTNIEKYLTGMAQPKLNQAQLNTIKIPWPPVKMQEQFAALVEQADKSKYYEINETIYGIL